MEKTLKEKNGEKSPVNIEEVQEAIEKKKKLQEMLRNAEEQKDTVDEKIYLKVKSEYQSQLDKLQSELAPMQKEILDARDEISSELKEMDNLIRIDEENVAEVEFRFRVGEYDEETMKGKLEPIKSSLKEKTAGREKLLSKLEELETICDSLVCDADEHQNNDQETGPPPEMQEYDSRKTAEATPEEEVFENPGDWVKDLDDETKPGPQEAESIRDVPAGGNDDIFNEGTESSFEKREKEMKNLATQGSSMPMPILIMRTPRGIEKRIPVLPTTLTIGREHDNNIEIKDDDVARYHARIIHKKGKYILETLEGTQSTLVNNKRVTRAELKDKDEITMGKTRILFTYGQSQG